MKNEFFPNVEFNRKRRVKLLVYYVLLFIFVGGFGVYMFATKQTVMGVIAASIVIMLCSLIPTGLSQYPIKMKPLITFEGKTIRFSTGETVGVNDVLAVSVCIEVPQISKVAQENKEFLLKVASQRPTEEALGACDVTIKNEKGKEVIKYAIIDDCIGALEHFLDIGVKKYRIIYSQKKLVEEAKYKLKGTASHEERLSDLSEKQKIQQLL